MNILSLLEIIKANNNQFNIIVTPKASSNRIIISEDDHVRVYVTVTPEDGKANNQVIKLLAKELRIPRSKIRIAKGLKSRNKTVIIED